MSTHMLLVKQAPVEKRVLWVKSGKYNSAYYMWQPLKLEAVCAVYAVPV